MAPPSLAAREPVEPTINVIMYFDTEDYLLPADDDAIKRLCEMLTQRGIRATFHDGCHCLRELGIKKTPRILLGHVQGLQLVEMSEAETCRGFGGTFAAKFPMISTAMGEVKCASAGETGAEYIVSNDSSCLMQIQGLLSRQGRPLKTIHFAEVLA